MKIQELEKITTDFFGPGDVSLALGIARSSAIVTLNRYAGKGLVIRLKRGLYVLKTRWENLADEDKFKIANILQVPSYISFMTALCYWGVSTQIQRGYIESAVTKRTYEKKVRDTVFDYTKIDRKLYFGFVKEKGVFIATKEKAFLDAMYLASFNKYSIDISSIGMDKFDRKSLYKMLNKYPERTKKFMAENGYIKEA